jgi:hypothetical protein
MTRAGKWRRALCASAPEDNEAGLWMRARP